MRAACPAGSLHGNRVTEGMSTCAHQQRARGRHLTALAMTLEAVLLTDLIPLLNVEVQRHIADREFLSRIAYA